MIVHSRSRVAGRTLGLVLLLTLCLAATPLTAQDSVADAAAALADSMADYKVSESDVSIENEGQMIVGTLAMPVGEGPFPVVLAAARLHRDAP